jgi:flagellar protein FlaJ
MPLFGGKRADKGAGAAEGGVVGFTKPKRFLFFKVKAKPVFGDGQKKAVAPPGATGEKPAAPIFKEVQKKVVAPPRAAVEKPVVEAKKPAEKPAAEAKKPSVATNSNRPAAVQLYFMSLAAKWKNLDESLKAQGVKAAPYQFVERMYAYAAILSAVLAIVFGLLMYNYGMGAIGLLLAFMLGIAAFQMLSRKFVNYPVDRARAEGTNVEKDLLFAARDLVISMRSGMPLFNAMATVSTGYGAASKEFGKIVELIQLGTPAEQAIDEVSAKSQSKTFKRIMLQASVSIKVGADVVGALQGVVEEVTQERIIELRRYGQRLNVLSMFYMLFGVIFPSMGVAIAVILTTFVSVISVDNTTLIFVIVLIFFLQVIFLNIMRSSRPVFAM